MPPADLPDAVPPSDAPIADEPKARDAARHKKRRLLGKGSWAGWMPNGLGQVKPNHYGDMLKVAWRNRDNLPYAWRILNEGVCDGCALGTTGLRDFTMEGVHLCTVRLNLLRLNTMGPLDPTVLADVAPLRERDGRALRDLGRLPYPMLRRHGEAGFRRVSWDEAMAFAGKTVRATDPDRVSFFLTSRGLTNESYYTAQKMVRFLGTNNIDNSSRICHAPSTTAMKQSLGVAASTCSYSDWIGADLVVFFGSDVPNNQPVSTKYLYMAKQHGTEIAVVNPYREPGMERYWVPSVFESAVFGTRLTDHFQEVHTGGDIAFINGVLKALIAKGGVDHDFVAAHTEGWEALEEALAAQPFDLLEHASGATRAEMEAFADLLMARPDTVFVWSMGLTQHVFGTENVQAVCNLALARGSIGREKTGLMPIRGHSGVQGSAEMGAVPNALPGGVPLADDEARRRLETAYGFPIPTAPGLDVGGTLRAAKQGALDVLWSVGGNFMETMPDPREVEAALANVPVRVHQDIVLSSMMFVDPPEGGAVLLLPSMTRYEQPGGGTETTTERRVIFSPEIRGRRIGEARSEWEIFQMLAAAVDPERAKTSLFADAQAIRDEIAEVAPSYDGIQHLKKKGDAFQWGGPRLAESGRFPLEGGRARFVALVPPEVPRDPDLFVVSTRRGRQFNSMVERHVDPLTGAAREAVLMAEADATRLGLGHGDAVVLESPHGRYEGVVHVAPIRAGNLQVHWPEGNVLLAPDRADAASGTPDYNALVRVLPARSQEAGATVEAGVTAGAKT